MRKVIIHLILMFIIVATLLSLDCGFDTWQYWVILIGCCFMYVNADSESNKNKCKTNDIKTTYIRACTAKTIPLSYEIRVRESDVMRIPKDKLEEMQMDELSHQLAKALVPYIKIDAYKNFYNMERVIKGTVRVVEPDFKEE
jgi:hypothetical protein